MSCCRGANRRFVHGGPTHSLTERRPVAGIDSHGGVPRSGTPRAFLVGTGGNHLNIPFGGWHVYNEGRIMLLILKPALAPDGLQKGCVPDPPAGSHGCCSTI